MKLVKPGNLVNIVRVLKEADSSARSFKISDIINPVIGGFKYCKWCAKNPVYGQKAYCTDDCRFSMMVFCYPQTFPATRILLERQNFKCSQCGFSYMESIEQAFEELSKTEPDVTWDTHNEWIVSKANTMIPDERKPETDHIVPISAGGENWGLSNVEIKCKSCHKQKTAEEARARNRAQNTYSGTRSTYKKIRDNKIGDQG